MGRDGKQGVYPPRYFVGWIILETVGGRRNRTDFVNALMIPVSKRRAHIYAGSWTTAFYADPITDSRLQGRLHEIQYAISALNARTLKPVIEKFKHPFGTPPWFYRDTDHFVIAMPHGGREDLFLTAPLHDVLDGVQGATVPVVQFIA
jgi:hypothetical protein